MPLCCPTLRNLCNQTCEEKEYQISKFYVGCISHFTYGYTANELTSLGLVEVVDPEDDPTTGLVEFCHEGEDFDLIEDGTYDRATSLSTWTDSTEALKIYSAITADDDSVRGLLGKQVWAIAKLRSWWRTLCYADQTLCKRSELGNSVGG